MKTYDETIDAIFSKGDALIEQRRQKSVKIKQTSYAVSGVCAAAIVGVGIWRMNDLKKLPDNRHSEIETMEETTTTGTQTETYTTTSTVVSDTEKTKNTTAATTKNTVTSSSQTTTDKGTTKETTQSAVKTEITESASKETTNIETTAKQTIKHSEITTTQTEKATTIDTTPMTTVQPDTTTKTYDTITESVIKQTTITTTATNAISGASPNGEEGTTTTTTQFTDDITRNLPSIFNTISLTGADSLDSKMREQGFVYSYDLINEDDIDDLLKEIHLNVNYEGNDIERDARIYKIKRFSADAMTAVKFEGRDDYFLYCNKLYAPETLSEFISVFELDSDDYTKKCYRGIMEANNISSEELWDIITGYGSLPNVTESCKGKDFRMQEAIWLELTADQSKIFKFGIDPHGYIIAGTNTFIPDSYFYIGEEKAEEIIGYCK